MAGGRADDARYRLVVRADMAITFCACLVYVVDAVGVVVALLLLLVILQIVVDVTFPSCHQVIIFSFLAAYVGA